ncbi:lactonase family protein [Robertkochia aurantiaca]|uniref:lactonase family protein n=1 Tax=Robertkochia aurantiaca TaxID=2873700 RepID=UPI001CCA00C1|nr:lactonase family protein [Robertkochia sp. 3YJGBD-33]
MYKGFEFYVGTYTEGESKSEGIYKYRIDAEGQLDSMGLWAATPNPSFLSLAGNGPFLLAVNEMANAEGQGTVTAFRITDSSLVATSSVRSGGAHPCYIQTRGTLVLVANYTGGNIMAARLDEKGVLTEALSTVDFEGSGTHERQESPHAHSIQFLGATDTILTADLGTDKIWLHKLEDQKLEPLFDSQSYISLNSESGPRHLDRHSNGQIYVLNELSNTINVLQEASSGRFEITSSHELLRETDTVNSLSADIHLSRDERFLYASTRGANTITAFEVKNDGDLFKIATYDLPGDWPRNFAITPDNNFIVVAHQNSNDLVSYRRDTNTGELTLVDQIHAPAPVCIRFSE